MVLSMVALEVDQVDWCGALMEENAVELMAGLSLLVRPAQRMKELLVLLVAGHKMELDYVFHLCVCWVIFSLVELVTVFLNEVVYNYLFGEYCPRTNIVRHPEIGCFRF